MASRTAPHSRAARASGCCHATAGRPKSAWACRGVGARARAALLERLCACCRVAGKEGVAARRVAVRASRRPAVR
eukprot:7302430-Prymnesium_polylepis.1